MSIFGWSLPPGCTHAHIDAAFGVEGPLDCPVCADGKEMDGPDCPRCACVMCAQHGCPTCDGTEKQRRYCAGPFCGDYLRADNAGVADDGRLYCSDACAKSAKCACDQCGMPGYVGLCHECSVRAAEEAANREALGI